MPNEGPKAKGSQRRRDELRRAIPKPGIDFKALILRRELVNTLAIFFAFFLAAGAVTVFSQNELRLESGQITADTRVKRLPFTVLNETDTEQKRREAREAAPHIYQLNEQYLNGIRDALTRLPIALEGVASVEEVADELRQAFPLDQTRLEFIQEYARDGEVTEQWQNWMNRLVDEYLPETPTLASTDVQVERIRRDLPIFKSTTGRERYREFFDVKEVSETLKTRWQQQLQTIGVPGEIIPMVIARLSFNAQPIYTLDQIATQQAAEQAAAAVDPIRVPHESGETIFMRGDRLSPEQIAVAQREQVEYEANRSKTAGWFQLVGTYGLVGLITVFIAGYLIRFYPKIVANPWRVIAIAVLSLVMLTVAAWWSARAPGFLYPAALATTLMVGIILVVAYDQRLATMVAGLQCALTTFALNESVGFFILLAAVAGAAIASLRQVRHRNALIRTAFLSAIVAGIGTFVVMIFKMPLTAELGFIEGIWQQVGTVSGLSFIACVVVGFLLLGILPSIEHVFDMTTGMTLVELRDPRMPLLRQLQERAPGTYNHSLAVATVAETAADAIGADSLLTYVGALYHDVGKMNKPDYFVENQSGGPNRHDKLSPAMSLLIIIGHVKDGIELAKEYNLPKNLLHFIEAHHGTTLVEYFYHAAKNKAESEGDGDRVDEVEFRYPGPRPRTKEAAILMISDCCESATRAMKDPAPAAIENLVRKLARKRLADGQFDECDLTLRELSVIEDAVIRSIWSLHHGRVAYPKGETPRVEETHVGEAQTETTVERRTAS